jgi:hypothetical protein
MTFEEYKEKNDNFVSDEMDIETNVNIIEDNDVNEIFSLLLNFQAQLKVMHWGTSSYAEHKAYQKTYESIDEGLDSLVESYQGYNSSNRISFGGTLTLINFDEVNVNDWLVGILELLNRLRGICDKTDLQNMVDELISSVSKLMYLLTLK